MAAIEIKPEGFTDRLAHIFLSVQDRLPAHLRNRDLAYFFPRWRHFMELGLARAWEIPDAVLGCLFTPDVFSGKPQADVVFWFSLPGTKGTRALLDSAEAAAREMGCLRISIAAFGALEGERIAELYRAFGYSETERVFQKEFYEREAQGV